MRNPTPITARTRRLRLAAATTAAATAAALISVLPAVAATSPGPPPIHETFTLLPCPKGAAADTTLGQEGCLEHKIVATDTKIDALDRTIYAELQGATARKDFIAGHKAWLGYRRTYCLSVSDVEQGGTEAPLLDAGCTAQLSTQHLRDLRAFSKDLNQ